MMTKRYSRAFWIVLLLTICLRLVLFRRTDLWHGETLWLMRSAADPAGSPLFCLLAQLWSAISVNEIWLRTLPFTFSVAAVLVIHRLSVRTFDSIGFTEATSLAVVSPVLCTAAWDFNPVSLEIFLAGLWLLAFLRALDGRRAEDWALHGAAALLAMSANPLMLLLLPGQALALAVFRRGEPVLIVRWLMTIGPGVILVAAVLFAASTGEDQGGGHPAPRDSLNGYDVGYLFTDISLGRLHPWKPLPPAFTFAKPGFEDPLIEGRQVGAEDEASIHSFFQVAQFLITTWFFFALVLACLSVWRLRTWILPDHLRSRALLRKVQEPGHETALILLLSIFVPPVVTLCAGWRLDQPFPEQRLFFIAVPFLVIVGRGLTRFQWVVIRYGFVLIVAAVSFLYSLQSIGLGEALDGIGPALERIDNEWDPGDRLQVAPCLEGPVRFHAKNLTLEAPAPRLETGRLWMLRYAPEPGGWADGAAAFVDRVFAGRVFEGQGGGEDAPSSVEADETFTEGRYSIDLYEL